MDLIVTALKIATIFQKGEDQNTIRIFSIARINDETKIGLAITAPLLKYKIILNCIGQFFANKIHDTLVDINETVKFHNNSPTKVYI